MQTTSLFAQRGICRLASMLNRMLRVAPGLLFILTSLAAHAVNESDLLPPERAFPLRVTSGGPQQVVLYFDIQPGYYLYRDRFTFAVDGSPIKPEQMPRGELKNDPTFGMVTVYHKPVQIQVSLPRPIATSVVLSVTSQGCADLGVCYPPQTRNYRVSADGSVTSVTAPSNASAANSGLPGVGESQSPAAAPPGMNLHPANGISVPELLGFLFAGLDRKSVV